MKTTRDKRYTITLEFCGHPEARYVARFCGTWIGQAVPAPRHEGTRKAIKRNGARNGS